MPRLVALLLLGCIAACLQVARGDDATDKAKQDAINAADAADADNAMQEMKEDADAEALAAAAGVDTSDPEPDQTGFSYRTDAPGKCAGAEVGAGEKAGHTLAMNDAAYIHYVGRATHPKTGASTLFDDTRGKHRPAMRIYVNNDTSVIPGLHLALEGMCLGEKRTASIPPHLAYGRDGTGTLIPPSATLSFEFELVHVVSAAANRKLWDDGIHIDSCIHSAEQREVLANCLNAGVPADTVSQDGRSFVSAAAYSGGLHAVRELIKRGADVNHALPNGVTPLMYASGEGHNEIVDALLAAKADVRAEVIEGRLQGYTALHFATMLGRYDNVVTLLKAGAKPHPKASGDGKTPLELLRGFVADKGSVKKSTDGHFKNAKEKLGDIEKIFELYSTDDAADKNKKDEL